MAGAADKMAQLYAIRDCVTVISSLPESLRRIVHFPTQDCALMVCTAPIPRLTMHQLSEPFLVARGYTEDHRAKVKSYADEIMASFGSIAYVVAVEVLLRGLADEQERQRAGLSEEEGKILMKAIM